MSAIRYRHIKDKDAISLGDKAFRVDSLLAQTPEKLRSSLIVVLVKCAWTGKLPMAIRDLEELADKHAKINSNGQSFVSEAVINSIAEKFGTYESGDD